MNGNKENTEQLILHAIEVWDREMKALFQSQSEKSCPHCPKRFIYGCFCSFERQFVEQAIERMLDKGALRKHVCETDPDEYYLEKAGVQ